MVDLGLPHIHPDPVSHVALGLWGQVFVTSTVDEGVSSNRPELVTLKEFLDSHEDDINLLYLTDSEVTLQVIHKLVGCGVKLNLSKSTDVDVLKRIIIKLQKRVQAGAVTLLVKVKDHRGDPLNEEAGIRTEMGHRKEQKEVIWDNPTN